MRPRLFKYFLRVEYVFSSLLVVLLVYLMVLISEGLPDVDETSFLDPILDRLDFLNIADVTLDAIFAIRDAEFADERIWVVNIGEVAPTPDGLIAMALYKLHHAGASVIGLDIFFDDLHFERFPEHRRDEIDALVQALHDVPNVVVASGFDSESLRATVVPHPMLAEVVKHHGFANLVTDDDDVVRRFLPHAEVDGERWLSLPVKMLAIYDSAYIERLLHLPSSEQIIFYSSTYDQIQTVPIADVVFGNMYDDVFDGAIVLIGFVNEGGLYYLGDTHRTPMGRKVGMEGPDMPGILIHANVIDMLLKNQFISAVPVWVDWVLVFLLSYISIVLYRIFRTKAANRFRVAILIMTMLFTEAVIVFFLPLIAFFYLDIKISYNLMATAVFLFIPSAALVSWLRVPFEGLLARSDFDDRTHPVAIVFREAFRYEEPFIAHMRLVHACLYLTHFAWAKQVANECANAQDIEGSILRPELSEWRRIPTIEAEFTSHEDIMRQRQYFLRYLEGRKDQLLRDSITKDLYFSTELPSFNKFVSFEEWEMILPHARRLWSHSLRGYSSMQLMYVDGRGADGIPITTGAKLSQTVEDVELLPGVYGRISSADSVSLRMSPWCEFAECKLHRNHELFVFGAMIRKQYGLPTSPAYYGMSPACEPVLPAWTLDELRVIEQRAIMQTTHGVSS